MSNAFRIHRLLMVVVVSSAVAAPTWGQAPMRVGEHFPITIDSSAPSAFETASTPDGRIFEVGHKGATYIALHFSDFDLEDDEMVIVSDVRGIQRYTLTGEGKMEAGTFWAQHIKGDTVVIEYVSKGGSEESPDFVIDEYVAGNVNLGGPVIESICGANDFENAVCRSPSIEYDRGKAVARLLINGSSLCTGWLASANSHLITNEHCITTASDALNTDYEFMAEAPSCGSSNCQLCFPGTVFSGATFIQDSPGLDYALVQINNGNPAATYGFLAIDNRTAVVGEQVYLVSHPSGRAKEFAYNSSEDAGGVGTVLSLNEASCSGATQEIGYNNDTEGGSSGSPVLAVSSQKVIALHHCRGNALNCGDPNRGVPIDQICAEICGFLGPQCSINADCDDADPCTTDVCSGGSCSNTPISCPTGQVCNGGVCEGQGACCSGTSCTISSPTNCTGSYLGDGSACGTGQAGNPATYQNAPNVTIPDGGGSGNPATDTINVPDSVTIGDLDVDFTISHTWVGDLTVQISHGGTTVTIMDRPGVPGSTYGCSNDNFSGTRLDDEGTGGTIESQCAANLSSPPNYTPNNPMSAFDGMDSAGAWTITVFDSVSADGGTLNSWSLYIDGVGSNPCTGCTTNAECDDGVFCNGAETCVAGSCQAGTAVDCNDGVGCTTDSCNEGTASCDNIPNDGNCDDGLFCNGAETCDAVNDCQAGTAVNCNDGVACTDDSCNEGTNSCDNIANNANCDNGIFCDGAETCDAVNDCQAGTAVNCNDGVGCTDDSCNEATNSCDNIANNANCDDGLFCNGTETCDAVNDCQAGTAVNCNDGVGCTDDACNEATNSCDNVANNANCDDGLFCNGTETCDAVNDCQAGTAVNCNDGVGCTDDACNEGTNSCDNIANNANCDNGIFCDGAETCDAALDCQAGTAVNCNDGVGCTDDSCNEGTNSCDNIANNANCDDGLFCNGSEICDAVNDCLAGTAVNCNDGVGCTDDSCNEATNSCDNVANNANCPDDGIFCNGTESCSATLDCVSSGDPCGGLACDEGTASCVTCLIDADCDDGLFCNGVETCSAGTCLSGTAVDCNDGVGCTTDSCNEATASCDNVANNASCDNGIFCDGAEICDAVFDCQAGTAVNCDDGVACTDDACNEGTNSCDNVANNANCDDGLFCNGVETCDAVNDCLTGSDPCPGQLCDEGTATCNDCLVDADCDDGVFCNGAETCLAGVCQAGTAVNCNDGVACTDDSCNEATASCDNIANDANCDNGLFCDGVETCDAVLDCQAGTAVNCNDGVACTDDSCNEGTNSCDNVANNANCPDDGLFCNGTESCDAINDCVSSGDPCQVNQVCNEVTNACDSTGPPPGEGFILSRNADFSTDDRSFFRNETLYMKMWTDQVDFNDISRERYELKDTGGTRIRNPLTNHLDGSWTASFVLNNLPTNDTVWTWKGEVKDNPGNRYKPQVDITVLDAPACSINADCDDGDACTTDVCSAGTCSNTPISCDDGDPCTSDTCSGGVCSNNPLPTCCGDGFCDPGEDSCNCPSDCGAPPASETNCTDGIDEDCDGKTDCADADCSGDPACSTPTGEGYILSLNPDFSTDDRVYNRNDIIYMKVWSDQVDFNDMNRERWELKDPNKNKIRQPMTNHFDGTWTASFDLTGLPSGDTSWTWKGEVKDNPGTSFKPTDVITVNP